MGGYVALEMARLVPDRVQGLALLSTSYKSDTAEKRAQRWRRSKWLKATGFAVSPGICLAAFCHPQRWQMKIGGARAEDGAGCWA